MNLGSGHEAMFMGLVNNSDGKSLDMDIESLDRTELQRSVRMYVRVETRGGLFLIDEQLSPSI